VNYASDQVLEPVAAEMELLLARLNRAEVHSETFGHVWETYLDSRPHRLGREKGPDGTVILRLLRLHPLPVELSILLGEFLYELRAALDNCLYAVAVITSGQNPPPEHGRLEWPIRTSASDWASQASRYRSLPEKVVARLEVIQPYNAEIPGWNSLGLLHELARVDRHRSAHGIALYLSELDVRVESRQVETLYVAPPGLVDDGEELIRIRVAEGLELSPDIFDVNLEFDVDVSTMQEAIGPSGLPGRPWGSLDNRLRALVKATREYTSDLVAISAVLASPAPHAK